MRTKFSGTDCDPIPPWATSGLWQAVNKAMRTAIQHHDDRLDGVRMLAAQIRARTEALDPYMHALCAETCPHCAQNCCRRATVWLDFRDLLGLHLGPDPIPPGQLTATTNQTCRYLTESGCVLPRPQRPFVCTWFICAAQKLLAKKWPSSHSHFFWNSLSAIKNGRKELENEFIQIVAGYMA